MHQIDLAIDRRAVAAGDSAKDSGVGSGEGYSTCSAGPQGIHRRFIESVTGGFAEGAAFGFCIFEHFVDRHSLGGFDRNRRMFRLVFLQPRFENFGDCFAIWISELGIFLHHFHADAIEFTGAIRAIDTDIWWHDVLMFDDTACDATVGERRVSGQEEVHGATEAVDIRAVIDGVAIESLFWSEVIGGSEDFIVVLHGQ